MAKQSPDIPALDVIEPSVINPSTKGQKETELQPSFDWQRDPKNPVNWSPFRQWSIITLLWGTNTVAYVPPVISLHDSPSLHSIWPTAVPFI